MMEWKLIRKQEAERILLKWETADQITADPSDEYTSCRMRLLDMFTEVKTELNIQTVKGNEYQFDLQFGLKLYTYFKEELRVIDSQASNDSFWIYIGFKVIPDIVFWRWGPLAHDRFYASSRRIWLKALWWYIHLSWQDNREETMKVLEKNTTDEIVQLVERSGPFGYRVKLCRMIMKKYSQYEPEMRTRNTKLFRRAMKLNTARLAVIEPALYEGEEEGYVQELFSKVVTG